MMRFDLLQQPGPRPCASPRFGATENLRQRWSDFPDGYSLVAVGDLRHAHVAAGAHDGGGCWKMIEEIAEMKSNSLSLASGVLRLQIAVPPSIKAVNWLFSQHSSSKIFPQFFLSTNKKDDPVPLSLPDGLLGVSGIGAAVYIAGSSPTSATTKLRRYLSADSPLTSAYGFMGIDYDNKSSHVERVSHSFYAVIPQIELDEFEDCSILALTLAWDDSLLYTLDQAISSAELKLCQVNHSFCSSLLRTKTFAISIRFSSHVRILNWGQIVD
ncbi:unnamed protein product [Spirodela intermedia]|uniref:Uncharacterized protein n=1 Tax=Spirodela intermedia TaxID=51605 RepID=A0A7I8JKJ3_SPIIN|nr:unnamed protein product [Spirodela intermedia]CAA6670668.1 unnamed protein product [Spirodela intermedia]